MLIIPLTGKLSSRNLPFITISLILINCIVFFLFQLNENKQYIEAKKYYFESGLVDIEIAQYIKYKYTADQQESMARFNEKNRREKHKRIYMEMLQDQAFMERLERGEIITPNDPDYSKWKNLRKEYTHRLSKVVTIRFGFKPVNPSIITLFTHMFLHGGIGHLVGNMIFLWLVGCLLEMGSGRIYFFTTYILTGLCAVGMFWLWNINSLGPLVGASGAISGLMGAFTVLYGRKKIKIFYTIGVYFDYIQIRAIFLLPLWVGSEVYQLAFSEIRHVAYLAHIGGLLSGALLGFINKKYLGFYKEDAVEPEPEDEISPLLEKALEHISRLEMEKGAKILNEVLDKDPENIIALKHLFDIYKTKSEDKHFHHLTKRLLLFLSKDEKKHNLAVEVYSEYIKRAKKPILSAELYLQLIPILSTRGYPEKAEHILAMFLNKKPDFPGLSTVLLKLANGYKIKENYQKQKKCLTIICSKFSSSPEAQMAKSELDGLSSLRSR
jgi:membrane associated rhomboid family serine protease